MANIKKGQFSTLNQFQIGGLKWLSRKMLIQYGVMLAVLFIFAAFFFVPVFLKNRALASEIKILKSKIHTASIKVNRIPEMKRQQKKIIATVDTVQNKMFEQRDVIQLIGIISEIATKNQVEINSLNPGMEKVKTPPSLNNSISTLTYNLQADGKYHDLGKFINGLETFSGNITVNNLDIESGRENSDRLESSFEITAFIKK